MEKTITQNREEELNVLQTKYKNLIEVFEQCKSATKEAVTHWEKSITELIEHFRKENNISEIRVFVSCSDIVFRLIVTKKDGGNDSHDIRVYNYFNSESRAKEYNKKENDVRDVGYSILGVGDDDSFKKALDYGIVVGFLFKNIKNQSNLYTAFQNAWSEVINLTRKEVKASYEASDALRLIDNIHFQIFKDEIINHIKVGNALLFTESDYSYPSKTPSHENKWVSAGFQNQLIDILDVTKNTIKVVVYEIIGFNNSKPVLGVFNSAGNRHHYKPQRFTLDSFLKEYWHDFTINKNLMLQPLSDTERSQYIKNVNMENTIISNK